MKVVCINCSAINTAQAATCHNCGKPVAVHAHVTRTDTIGFMEETSSSLRGFHVEMKKGKLVSTRFKEMYPHMEVIEYSHIK